MSTAITQSQEQNMYKCYQSEIEACFKEQTQFDHDFVCAYGSQETTPTKLISCLYNNKEFVNNFETIEKCINNDKDEIPNSEKLTFTRADFCEYENDQASITLSQSCSEALAQSSSSCETLYDAAKKVLCASDSKMELAELVAECDAKSFF